MPEERQNLLSNSEWSVMECLWAQAPQTLMQLVKCLKDKTGWAKSTVTTVVSRMESKRLVYFESGEKAKLYYPAFSRDDAAIQETQSLLSRVYQGSIGLMMNTLIQKQNLSKEELDELYAILHKAEADKT